VCVTSLKQTVTCMLRQARKILPMTVVHEAPTQHYRLEELPSKRSADKACCNTAGCAAGGRQQRKPPRRRATHDLLGVAAGGRGRRSSAQPHNRPMSATPISPQPSAMREWGSGYESCVLPLQVDDVWCRASGVGSEVVRGRASASGSRRGASELGTGN
jgi:hypothetical protein